MNMSLTRNDDIRTYSIVYKLLSGDKLSKKDMADIAVIRTKLQTALTNMTKDNFELQASIIGKMCIIEHYIALFSDMLFEGGDNE